MSSSQNQPESPTPELSLPELPTTQLILRSLLTAPLLVNHLPSATPFPRHLLSLPTSPEPLNFRQKLGHLLEDALAQLLTASPHFHILEKSLQIRKDKHTTVGELDFLLRDLSSHHLIHLELATKFYLVCRNGTEIHLPGPDSRDNFFRKITHLQDHQLQLTKNHHLHLPPAYQNQPITPQHLIYGCLFDHIHQPPLELAPISPHRLRGRWLRLSELPQHFPQPPTFSLIPKPLWPLPPELLPSQDLPAWTPPETLHRTVMVLPQSHPLPHFITPDSFPEHQPPS